MRKFISTSAIWALAVMAALTLQSAYALGALKFPEPKGYVNDFAGVLTPSTRDSLERRLTDYHAKSGNEIAVVTVKDLQGTTVEDYAVRLFEKWKIGERGKDNGILLLVAEKERKVRIEVGYGLEPKLTDVQASSLINRTISPAFKKGDFDGGLSRGVDGVISTVSGEGGIPTGREASTGSRVKIPGNAILGTLSVLFFLGIGLIQWFAAVLARTKSWWAGGLIGALVGLGILVFAGLAVGITAIVVLATLGLLFDHYVSKGYRKSVKDKNDPPWWAGGAWGPGGGWFGGFGGSGSGGGFGGFGGGESGGGGASGDW